MCKVLPTREAHPVLGVQGGTQYPHDWPQLLRPQPPRARTGVCHKSYCSGRLKWSCWYSMAQGPRYAKTLTARICQGLRVHLPGARQRPVLKTDLSLACSGFEHSRTAKLILSFPVCLSQIAETKDKEKTDTYKGMTVITRAYFLPLTTDARRQWNNIFQSAKWGKKSTRISVQQKCLARMKAK